MKVTEYQPGVPSWVDLATPDLEAAKAFYGALFGWSAETDPAPEVGGYTIFTLNGEKICGAISLTSPDQGTAWSSYVTVEDADKTIEAVTFNGGSVMAPVIEVTDAGRMAVFLDPQGAALGIWQPGAHKGAGLVNEPGALAWSELLTWDTVGARDFYQAVFGWESKTNPFGWDGSGNSPFGRGEFTEWQVAGRIACGMMQMGEQFPPDLPPHWAVYFSVADCDASAVKVGELGGTVPVPPSDVPGIARCAVCKDPQGAAFAIIAACPG